MWYDKLKEEKILIHQDGEHNKFWAGRLHESTNTVDIRWGRIGTKGGSQSKTFGSLHQAAHFLEVKFNEKRRKGYVDKHKGEPIDSTVLEKLAVEAAIVGTQNKCHNMQWVEIKSQDEKGAHFVKIKDQRLFEPDCVPGLLVQLETKKEYHNANSFNLLFTGDAAFIADVFTGVAYLRIGKTDTLYELTKKVEEAVGRSLS